MTSIYQALEKAIQSGDQTAGVDEAIRLIESGTDPLALFSESIEPLLDDIGEKFSRLEIFLPEMVNASKVVKEIHESLKPYLTKEQNAASKGRIIIATVSGDLHDIGKNIVKAMLEVNGFDVKDLGVDVPTQTIVKTAKEFQADIIALSALMLPSLPFVKDVIEFMEASPSVKVIVGGGPVNAEWAKEAGTDGYGDNAIDAVALVKNILSV
ncbi:MAG: cobalamin B12-binding domain-containing protein [Chloroflexi bacterium]|nr:cobalamin B12-binding domain-containing protein [Chloroflexota bacterium]